MPDQSVLFKGNLLKAELDLEDAGIADGDTVNVVPSKKPKAAASVSYLEYAHYIPCVGDDLLGIAWWVRARS